MLKKTILIYVVFLSFCHGMRNGNGRKSEDDIDGTQSEERWKNKGYEYPELYRDHVFRNLSAMGKEMFHAVNIHPLCLAKLGSCRPRNQCTGGMRVLYFSRVCYKKDHVCCYDNVIKKPQFGLRSRTSTTTTTEHTTTLTANTTIETSTKSNITEEDQQGKKDEGEGKVEDDGKSNKEGKNNGDEENKGEKETKDDDEKPGDDKKDEGEKKDDAANKGDDDDKGVVE